MSRRAAWFYRFAIVVWLLIALQRAASALTGHDVAFNTALAILNLMLSIGSGWELYRRSDPRRTAGWGRGNS